MEGFCAYQSRTKERNSGLELCDSFRSGRSSDDVLQYFEIHFAAHVRRVSRGLSLTKVMPSAQTVRIIIQDSIHQLGRAVHEPYLDKRQELVNISNKEF